LVGWLVGWLAKISLETNNPKKILQESKHCIDYMWFTAGRGLVLCRRLALPAEDVVPATRFPSNNWPSDHLSLVGDFAFTQQ
jgi:nocturnin